MQSRYSEEQLVKLRNSLEKSYEEFRDAYQQISEVESKESKSGEETFVEKLGFSEKEKPRSFVEAATARKIW